MICEDCRMGAAHDAFAKAIAGGDFTPGTDAAWRRSLILATNAHGLCVQRNADREPGQLPDCTCQHRMTEQ